MTKVPPSLHDGSPSAGSVPTVGLPLLPAPAVVKVGDFVSLVLDTAGVLVVVLDTEGRIRTFNPASEEISGYAAAEVQGKPILEFLIPSEEIPSVRSVIARLRAGQFPNRHENDWVTKNGERRRITWSNTCILDPAGQVQFIVGTGIDVTSQRQAEKAAREAAEQHQLALEAGQLGTWDYDLESGEVIWDKRCRGLFGINQGGRIEFASALGMVHEGDRPAVQSALQKALSPDSPGTAECEFRVVWPDGSFHWLATNGQAYFKDNGTQRRPVRLVGTIKDITSRRQIEETMAFLAQYAASPGQNFFQALARFLAEALGADYVCIDRLQDEALTAQTVAIFSGGKIEDNVSYTLKDTPCGELVGKTVCCFPAGVRHRFPKDSFLQELKAESYVGTTLWGSTGRPIGLIAVIGRRRLEQPQLAESILQLVAARTAGELERRRAEQAMQDQRDLLLLAQKAGRVGVFDYDFLAGRVFWSDECKALFGLPSTFEPTLESRSSCVKEIDRARVQKERERLLTARRQEVEQTYRIALPQGGERWLLERSLVTYDASGQPIRMVGTRTDITSEVRAKARTHARQRQFRATAVRTVIILAAAIFGAELLNMALLAWLPPLGALQTGLLDSLALVALLSPVLFYFAYRPLQAMLRQREQDEEALRLANEELESRVRERTASLEVAKAALLENRAALQKSHDDLEQRVQQRTAELTQSNAALAVEVAERRRAELAVSAERQRFEDVLNKLPAYLVLLTSDYRVAFANRFFEDRFGKAEGRRCYEYLFQRNAPCENCESFKVLKTRAPHHWEWDGPDGRVYDIHDSPFIDVDGSTLIMEVGLDITDRKVAERERQNLRDEFARVSRITTAGQLAASLAHELNQPLGAISCNVYAIQQYLSQPSPNHAEVQAALADIEADSRRAGAVIHQLRGMFRKTDRAMTALSLNDLLRKTLDLLHSQFVMKDIAVKLEEDPSLPPVRGNEVEVQQVVLNLITNAVEAMLGCPPGSRRLLIRTSRPQPGHILVSVRDSGSGIAPEELSRVFDPFYTTKSTGMGMGLPINRSIVEAHSGKLWAENNPDGGAAFHFTLPVFQNNLS